MFHHAQAVLFDLDGTLIDSAPDLGAAADKMRVDRGLPSLPMEHYRHMAGAGARGMLGIAFGMTPEHPDFEAMKEEFFVNYENCMTERTRIFDGVVDMVNALVAQGLANIVVPFFGGMPATGAIARTAVNVRSGGRTRLAAIAHAIVLLLVVLVLLVLVRRRRMVLAPYCRIKNESEKYERRL